MTFSDGKPSLLFETTEEAKELEDKSIMKFTVAIAIPGSDARRLMQDLATERVPTLCVIQASMSCKSEAAHSKERPSKFAQQQRRPHTPWIKESQGRMLYETGYRSRGGQLVRRIRPTPRTAEGSTRG